MKTILYKVKLMLFIIMLLVSVMPVFADEGSEVPPITLNVKAGELSSLIPESKKYKITNLKLIGELNIDDILFIREMGACRNYLNEGCLQHLDISDVTFVGHGSCWEYSEYGDLLSYVDLKTNEHIFYGSQSLQTIKLPRTLKYLGKGFLAECDNLVSVTLPSALNDFDPTAFDDCGKLTSIMIDAKNPYFHSDDSVLFNKDCTELVFAAKLTDYVIPNSVVRIRSSAFSNCSGLTSVTFPSGLTEIGSLAFSGCSGLTSLAFPSSLTTIGQGAFFNASNIKSIYSYASFPPKLGVDVFNDKVQQTSILYVPKDSYQDYWFSDTWGNFENIKTFDASAVEPVFTADDASETSRYTVGGQKQGNPVKGLNIIKMSDGSVKKIMVQ